MAVRNLIHTYQNKINRELDTFFNRLKNKYQHLDYTRLLIKSMEDFSKRGGKRLRPILMIQGYNLFKPENHEIIKASISIELIHNFLLVHDDVMDRDQLRRGGLTINKLYSNYFKSRFNNKLTTHLGDSTAITIGNIFFSLGNAIIVNSSFPEKNKCRALNAISEMITNVGIGQSYDIMYSLKKNLTEEEILIMYNLKTAVYSFSGPLVIGAILAGARKNSIKKIISFAKPLGLAFQIKDDLLDLYGTENTLGKSVGSDFREGKKTLQLTIMLKRSNPKEKRVIVNALGNKKLNKRDIGRLRKIGIETGTFDYCNSLSDRLINETKDVLRRSSYNKKGIDTLLQIADYVQKREL
ncbi:MAG: polyprenyl synthetase family protein [Thermodesulfobacteriota bacterium]